MPKTTAYNPRQLSWLTLFFGLSLAALVFLPATVKQQVSDDSIWISNGIKFQQALFDRDWLRTRLTTRPGVTVQWIAGVASWSFFGSDQLQAALPDQLSQQPGLIARVYWSMYAAAILASLILLILLRQVLSFGQTLLVFTLTLAHPFVTSPHNLVWTDLALMFFFVFTVLSFVIYQQKPPRRYLQAVTGVFFGAAVLTKIIGLSLPLYLFLLLKNYRFRTIIQTLVPVIVIGLVVFYIFYPASWQQPLIVFDRVTEINPASSPETTTAPLITPRHSFARTVFFISPTVSLAYGIALGHVLWGALRGQRPVHPVTAKLLLSVGVYILLMAAIGLFGDSEVTNLQSRRYLAPIWPLVILALVRYFRQVQNIVHFRTLPAPIWMFTSLVVLEIGVLYTILF